MIGPGGEHRRDAGNSKFFPAHRGVLCIDHSNFLGLVPYETESGVCRYSRYLADRGHDLYVDLGSTHGTDLTHEARPHHRVSCEQTDDHRSCLGGVNGGLDSIRRRSGRVGVDNLNEVGRYERFRDRHRRLVREHVPRITQHASTTVGDQIRVSWTGSNESDARCGRRLLIGRLRRHGHIGNVFHRRHSRAARLLLRGCLLGQCLLGGGFLHRFLLRRLLRLL